MENMDAIGYAATGTSPQLAARFQYFRDSHDSTVMNGQAACQRNRDDWQACYRPSATSPASPATCLNSLLEKMSDSLMRVSVTVSSLRMTRWLPWQLPLSLLQIIQRIQLVMSRFSMIVNAAPFSILPAGSDSR